MPLDRDRRIAGRLPLTRIIESPYIDFTPAEPLPEVIESG